MNVFLIFNEKSNINYSIDLIKKEIVDKLTKCKITIFNNTDFNINIFFENYSITVVNTKYNSLYISCVINYIIENYETMPENFIFWPIFHKEINPKIVNYIKEIDNRNNCDLFYISKYISVFDLNEWDLNKMFLLDKIKKVFSKVKIDDNMFKKVHWRFYEYEEIRKLYLIIFGEEICENTKFNYGEVCAMLIDKIKIHKNPIDYYKKILNYFTHSENIERDEGYVSFFLEKIFTGIFTNNLIISPEEIEEDNKRLEEENRKIEEENRKIEEEYRIRVEEYRIRVEENRIRVEENRKIEEENRIRVEEACRMEAENKNLIGPIEELEGPIEELEEIYKMNNNLIGSFGLLEIMENDMMFDINIIDYVDNTINLS